MIALQCFGGIRCRRWDVSGWSALAIPRLSARRTSRIAMVCGAVPARDAASARPAPSVVGGGQVHEGLGGGGERAPAVNQADSALQLGFQVGDDGPLFGG